MLLPVLALDTDGSTAAGIKSAVVGRGMPDTGLRPHTIAPIERSLVTRGTVATGAAAIIRITTRWELERP